MSDEHSIFVKWFMPSYGHRPKGNVTELNWQIKKLQEQVSAIESYELTYHAALMTWHECHSGAAKQPESEPVGAGQTEAYQDLIE